ncbi:bis(5'-nucleosyl)-tetraphosphatase (symmetrical) YqeK [Clostridiales bacterium BAD-6]|uniref:bis(5'-nucleosyl)-tetraphosphatase (symmetrical) n=2 Tax=Sinanaerobacter chloroacetimidivorans TaxID=2818044 RepID=A0A8J7VX50_9FIRM|nr:bis(5'-nucleosyl)-tetraphosphatase (symmetrical) YqeK [Sinanaerobacter chloroacetimidivorans]
MQGTDNTTIKKMIDEQLSEKRRIHTYAVAEEAKALANRYGADPEKAETAALFHDFFRGISEQELNDYVLQLGFKTELLNNNNLAHGKIAAYMMKEKYHITDEDVINAVSYHTTGRPHMSNLEKIIFLADAIEPNRKYPGVEELRKLAYQDLDRACMLSLERSIDYVRSRGCYLDEDTVLAKDYLIEEIKRKEYENE